MAEETMFDWTMLSKEVSFILKAFIIFDTEVENSVQTLEEFYSLAMRFYKKICSDITFFFYFSIFSSVHSFYMCNCGEEYLFPTILYILNVLILLGWNSPLIKLSCIYRISVTVTQLHVVGGTVRRLRLSQWYRRPCPHRPTATDQHSPRGVTGAREAVFPQPVVAQDVGGGRNPGSRQGSAGRSVCVPKLHC